MLSKLSAASDSVLSVFGRCDRSGQARGEGGQHIA